MVNLIVGAKRLKKTSFNTVKYVFKRGGRTSNISEDIPKDDNPLFFCSLCSKFMDYSDLVDGCKCCFCDKDLFIILWSEYKKEMTGSSKKSKKVCTGYLS